MAGADSLYVGDLFCPQCAEIYSLPVLLKCGHSICRVCLQKFWEWKGSRECPVCRTVAVPGRPPINLALKIAADEYLLRWSGKNREVCCLHSKELIIFCQNDERPICQDCQASKQHKVHDCCPVEEAAQQKKAEISTMLECLRKKLRSLNKTEENWEKTKAYIQTQASQNGQTIKEEFQKIHLYLREEEKTRLKVLKQEEEIKIQVMREKLENIKDQIRTLSSTISDIETALTEKDLPFLQGYRSTKKRVKCDIREPECIRDILINTAKHLELLKYGIMTRMSNIVKYAPITLDPNTAHPNLETSQELTCVQYSRRQLLPDNPERCTSRLCVLGATGFTSGKHSWTVRVGGSKDWYVGVVRESIKRKSTVFLEPAEGFWVIGLCNGGSLWAETSPRTRLALKQKPESITVELDCDKGKVVFVNAVDSTTIHTFRDRFTERIFPYISPGLCEEGKLSSPLTICPLTIKISVE